MEVSRSRVIACRPEDWLGLVLDVHRYRTVDDKIGSIRRVRRDGALTEFRFVAHLPGVPLPGAVIVSQMRLDPGRSVDVRLAPLPRNLLAHAALRFRARFSCEPTPGGTRVTRTVSFRFRPPVRWLLERRLRRALPGSVDRELRLAARLLEDPQPARGPGSGTG